MPSVWLKINGSPNRPCPGSLIIFPFFHSNSILCLVANTKIYVFTFVGSSFIPKAVSSVYYLFLDRGWDGWMASPTWWTWVWTCSRSWWWTGKPGVLQSMGLQRVGHDWVTELNWNKERFFGFLFWFVLCVLKLIILCITQNADIFDIFLHSFILLILTYHPSLYEIHSLSEFWIRTTSIGRFIGAFKSKEYTD